MARTAIIEAPGGPEQFRIVDMEVGEPGPGQIRIRHEACGLNFIDVYQRIGALSAGDAACDGHGGRRRDRGRGRGVTHLKPGTAPPMPRCPARRLYRSPRHECRAGLPAARRHLDRGRRGDDAQGADDALPVPPHDAHRARATRPFPCRGRRCRPDGLPMGRVGGHPADRHRGHGRQMPACPRSRGRCLHQLPRAEDWVARGAGADRWQGRDVVMDAVGKRTRSRARSIRCAASA
jgi:hypothetical protein